MMRDLPHASQADVRFDCADAQGELARDLSVVWPSCSPTSSS